MELHYSSFVKAFATVVVVLSFSSVAHACTTIIAGKDATTDGSVLLTHSNDGEGGDDVRLVKIPAMDWPKGSQRPIFFAPENYPRYVGFFMNISAYEPVGNQSESIPIGYIDQVYYTDINCRL